MSFPYKHILVIGATSGIGRAMAERFVENGAKVTVVGRRKERLDAFVSKYGEDKVQSMVFDITQTDKTPEFAKEVTTKYPDIDSVYLNAGIQRAHDLTQEGGWDLQAFNSEFHTNFTSAVSLVHAFLPFLKGKAETQPASFIFTGTNIAIVPAASVPAYSASKTALNVFVLSLREQLKQSSNLKVIEVSLPAVQTELHDYMGAHGATIGMPLDQFTDEAFSGLQKGLDQVIVGNFVDNETFLDIVQKRRSLFEKLAAAMRKEKKMPPIPITILTGFLGSGKTTLLLNLLPQLPKSYKLALLKNEFGDVAIDSQLASTSAITGVRELLNGCICCNLVGQLSDALSELESTVRPDRIIIETSGSAFPATLAMEVNRLSRESPPNEDGSSRYVLDGVVSVIDVENWAGYEDTSYTAKIQARYTDLIVFNKWEHASERRFDEVLDRVGDLEVQIPWVKSDRGMVEKDVLLGIDGALFAKEVIEGGHHEHRHGHEHADGAEHEHGHQSEVEVLSVTLRQAEGTGASTINVPALEKLLSSAPKEEVYRIKGIMRCSTQTPPGGSSDDLDARPSPSSNSGESAYYILNWAFGRWTCTGSEVVAEAADPATVARITFILARYESAKWKKKLEGGGLVHGHEAELRVERLV
ncbi:hypothetical protein BDW71DRAFT_199258 [Aspergillus fruticulosus]